MNKKEVIKSDIKIQNEFQIGVSNYISKIDKSINEFKLNVAIANFYEVYNFFKKYIDKEINKEVLRDNVENLMKIMIPFTPFLAHECLELLNCKTVNDWPKIQGVKYSSKIKLVIQINGKTRDVIDIENDPTKESIEKIVRSKSKASKYLKEKKIIKTIYVKNKIINYIIKN